MKLIRKLAVVTVAVGGLAPSLAGADIIILDFNDATPGGIITETYFEDGFRIEVLNCHYDIVPSPNGVFENPIDGTTWMGFDRSGCLSSGAPAHLRLDFFDAAFDILSLEVVFAGWTSLTSSNGGNIAGCADDPDFRAPCTGHLDLTGPEWRIVTYVDFISADDPGRPVGFDNIRLVAVAEPGTLALFSLGLLALVFIRRKQAALV